jgi:hypothetical protein
MSIYHFIHHYPCIDGYAAYWVANKAAVEGLLPKATLFEDSHYNYSGDIPDIKDKHVIILDCSYPEDEMKEILRKAESVLLLDHHKTAFDDLGEMIGGKSVTLEEMKSIWRGHRKVRRLQASMFKTRSGCQIAWDFFYPGKHYPHAMDFIADCDLGKSKLPKTAEIIAAISSYPYNIESYNEIMREKPDYLAVQGEAILRKQKKDLEEMDQEDPD